MSMSAQPQISASFPTARCAACDRYVLTYVAFEGDVETRNCVHCDGAVGSDLRWINASELQAEGYQFGAPAPASGGSCASGCGTCSVRKN
jgi:hypothetical protein